jgi:hypothetical protein
MEILAAVLMSVWPPLAEAIDMIPGSSIVFGNEFKSVSSKYSCCKEGVIFRTDRFILVFEDIKDAGGGFR